MESVKRIFSKLDGTPTNTKNENIKLVKQVQKRNFLIEYFNDPWIRWQTKAMFVLWIMSWLAGFVIAGWALFALPLTIAHMMFTAAFAFCSATIFWVSLQGIWLEQKLRVEEPSYESIDIC